MSGREPRSGDGRASNLIREVVRLTPAPGSARAAARSAITTLVALTVLVLAGRVELSLYATFGAFACVYGGRFPHPERWRTQASMGALLALCVAVGAATSLSADPWIAIPVTAGAAALAASASARQHWQPPGSFFVTFAVATSAAVPTTASGVVVATATAAATAAFAVGLGVLEERLLSPPRGRAPGRAPTPAPPAVDRVRLMVRTTLAVSAAGLLALVSGVGHSYWAMVASVAVMSGTTLTHQIARGVQRALGTVLGLIPALALLLVGIPLWAAPPVVAATQFLVEFFVARNYAIALVFITPLALLVVELADPQPTSTLLSDRLLETLIGVAAGSLAAILARDRNEMAIDPGR